jgi:hypothetical protein
VLHGCDVGVGGGGGGGGGPIGALWREPRSSVFGNLENDIDYPLLIRTGITMKNKFHISPSLARTNVFQVDVAGLRAIRATPLNDGETTRSRHQYVSLTENRCENEHSAKSAMPA